MSEPLLPQFHIVLPIDTPIEEVEAHARARIRGALAKRFDVMTVKRIRSGQILTKHGPVIGDQFLIVLRPLEVNDPDPEQGEVLYEHPDCKKLLIH